MFSLKSNQVFERTRKNKHLVPTPVITSSFLVYSAFFDKKLPPYGSFPRRVSIGEILFKKEKNKILSPINGLAYLSSEGESVQLRIDGGLNYKPQYLRRDFSLSELKDLLDETGVVSLDFPGELFSFFLDAFEGSKGTHIVLAPICSENQIDFKSILLTQYKPELESFKKNLEKLFPESRIQDFLTEKKVAYKYPEGIYKLFLKKYCNIHLNAPDHKKILFIAPETIYHIIQGVYYGIPFHERNVSIQMITKSGKLDGQPKYFKIKNGTDLSEFLITFKNKYNYKFFTINTMFRSQPIYEISEKFIFDIYQHHTVFLYPTPYLNSSESMCIDCGDCNYYCPVDANPLALLMKNQSGFRNDLCVECGLCSVFCPSKIDFQLRIHEVMKVKNAIT